MKKNCIAINEYNQIKKINEKDATCPLQRVCFRRWLGRRPHQEATSPWFLCILLCFVFCLSISSPSKFVFPLNANLQTFLSLVLTATTGPVRFWGRTERLDATRGELQEMNLIMMMIIFVYNLEWHVLYQFRYKTKRTKKARASVPNPHCQEEFGKKSLILWVWLLAFLKTWTTSKRRTALSVAAARSEGL